MCARSHGHGAVIVAEGEATVVRRRGVVDVTLAAVGEVRPITEDELEGEVFV
jgi:hypothetical protein